MNELPIWRSLLYVPVNVSRFVDSAHARGADAIQLDLEDSIAPSEKDEARTRVEAAAATIARRGTDVIVRINRPLALAVRDIEASIGPDVIALSLPKVASADHVRLLAELCSEIEQRRGLPEGHTRFIIMIETAEAAFHMDAIARSHPRIVGMTLGTEDFAADLGIRPDPDLLLPHHMTLVAAAASAGVLPLGLLGTISEFRDAHAFRATVERSRRAGMRGASCIHPVQVAILNETFAPSQDELAWARQVVLAYEQAHASGSGAIVVDGRMVDVPIANRARALLAWDAALQAHGKDRS
jgi:citrate lyase subunit beta/citryl-CoA lyase